MASVIVFIIVIMVSVIVFIIVVIMVIVIVFIIVVIVVFVIVFIQSTTNNSWQSEIRKSAIYIPGFNFCGKNCPCYRQCYICRNICRSMYKYTSSGRYYNKKRRWTSYES